MPSTESTIDTSMGDIYYRNHDVGFLRSLPVLSLLLLYVCVHWRGEVADLRIL